MKRLLVVFVIFVALTSCVKKEDFVRATEAAANLTTAVAVPSGAHLVEVIADNSYETLKVYSFGRNGKEYIITTFKCGYGAGVSMVQVED